MPGNQGHRREEVNKPARRYVSGDEGRHGIHACMKTCALDLFSMGRGGMRGERGGEGGMCQESGWHNAFALENPFPMGRGSGGRRKLKAIII